MTKSDSPAPYVSIAAVERDTGLSKDTLRVWERRYGFPQPDRDNNGERSYPHEQLEKLRTRLFVFVAMKVVPTAGIAPATPCSSGRCSTKLSYVGKW